MRVSNRLTALVAVSAGLLSGQGIPVTDPLVIAKCGSCHARDEHGNIPRISWERSTPESWQDELKQQILVNGLSVTPAEARSIVRYLSSAHGLAPDEAKPVLYDAERRIHEETNIPDDTLRDACAKCHPFARVLSWRRSPEEWKQFMDSHAARYRIPAGKAAAAAAFLAVAAPLHTAEWDAWSARPKTANLTGRWLVSAHLTGRGDYYGEMQIDRAGDDTYTTRVSLKSVADGSTITRLGNSAVFGGYAWRGRSTTMDEPAGEAREVMWIAPDQSAAEGRWFWGQYQEFGFDVKLRRPSSGPTVLLLDRSSLKAGSKANRIRIIGNNFPDAIAPSDLNFGPGTKVRRIVSHSPDEVVAEVDVALDARLGRRDAALRSSVLPGAMAIYDRIDYIKVTPDSAVAAFGDPAHPRGYLPFEAIGYYRGADGEAHTADDVALGPVDVTWSFEIFHAPAGSNADFVGTISPTGLFSPAAENPGNNFDTWAIATATSAKNPNGAPLVGKCYLVVTVPTYTFNGRRYVRELDRWVDDGPAARKP